MRRPLSGAAPDKDPHPMAVLQICIPTFERREHLMNTLTYLDSELQGDLHDFISVRILDNGSGYDIRDAVQSRFPYVQVDVNPENIGAPSSVVRLVREGQTEYVMVLGDDDDYRPGLLSAIRELLVRQQPDYIFLNHRAVWHDGRLALPTQLPPGEINSLLDIFNYTGPCMMFLGANVYRRAKAIEALDCYGDDLAKAHTLPLYLSLYCGHPDNNVVIEPATFIDNIWGRDSYSQVKTRVFAKDVQEELIRSARFGYDPHAIMVAIMCNRVYRPHYDVAPSDWLKAFA
ncbi:hypothetical protein DAI18_03315 [Microvirgula aerodenitrificans]|uniref:Glycosyltransferase 2-like domain-containing protein n=2 Tax=Microvirgula aerodenitrificans TaxID=57480 RepID=A0A2S0P6Y7_9NEIS|nr:hypothetical protein DAI18_03315 [Microvirgula aerodenitrificans]